jgi:V-type H+-transporting ATPase subunit a
VLQQLNAEINAFQRQFVNEVRRCDEMQRKIRYVEAEVKKDGVKINDCDDVPRAPNPREIIDLEAHLEKTENEIMELSQNAVNLKTNYLELLELRHVLEKTQGVFYEEEAINNDAMRNNLITQEDQSQAQNRGRLGFVAGVIQRERVPGFERMLWRISRGNVFLRQSELDQPLEDPATVSKQARRAMANIFILFFILGQ